MHDLDVLYAHIVAAPTDESLREEYADAVEATDPARAEFIRVQLATSRARAQRVDSYPLSLRAGVLLREHAHRWAQPVDQFVSGWSFRRGFVELVAVDAEWFLETAEELYRLAPILHLDFADAHLVTEELFASPHLERIRSISLTRNNIGDAELAQLAASEYLGNLQWLGLALNQIGPDGLEALAASTRLPRLGYVDLATNPVPDPTPRFCDEYDATSAVGVQLQERYGHRAWLDAEPRSPWPPDRDSVWPVAG